MNIISFLSQIDNAGGLARPNLFQVQIFTSNLVANGSDAAVSWITDYAEVDTGEVGNRLSMMCTAAELPGYQFATDVQHLYGPRFQFPVMPQYQDVTLTFFVGQDMTEKYFFDAWMFMIMDPTTNDFNYISEYSTTINILQFDDHDDVPYATTLVDAYPISIGAMRLDWENNNQVHKMDVTFTYKRLEPYYWSDSSSGVASTRARSYTPFNSTARFRGNQPTVNNSQPTNNQAPSE